MKKLLTALTFASIMFAIGTAQAGERSAAEETAIRSCHAKVIFRGYLAEVSAGEHPVDAALVSELKQIAEDFANKGPANVVPLECDG